MVETILPDTVPPIQPWAFRALRVGGATLDVFFLFCPWQHSEGPEAAGVNHRSRHLRRDYGGRPLYATGRTYLGVGL